MRTLPNLPPVASEAPARPPALSVANPPNPWHSTDVDWLGEPPDATLQVFEERARSIVSVSASPDLGRMASINPYRGCYHGCAYCYARPSHQYWGFGAGTDFERKLIVKVNAVELLRAELERPRWTGETITLSGNTDCYQPLESSYRLTRGLLEVCLAYRNPVSIITKSALVRRDVELLAALARDAHAWVTVSIPFADDAMARAIEPWAARPSARFDAVRALASAGVPVGVNIAPVIPGLNDDDIPELLERAHAAGATRAALIALRLPNEVEGVFLDRLRAALPLRAGKVESALKQIRGGKLYDPRFGHRMRGAGPRWDAVQALFDAQVKKLGLGDGETTADGDVFGPRPGGRDAPTETTFRRPRAQLALF